MNSIAAIHLTILKPSSFSQGANPAPAYADARDDAVSRGQPVAHGNAVVRRTQRRRDGTVRRQSDLDRVRHKLGLPLNPDPGMCSDALP
jgi:hypothetical protein